MFNLESLISFADTSRDFPKVARVADENGFAVIIQNDKPKYLLLECDHVQAAEYADDNVAIEMGRQIIEQYRRTFEELAK